MKHSVHTRPARPVRAITVNRDKLLNSPLVRKIASYMLRFITGYLVARGVTFGEYAPFGLAYVAAVASGRSLLFGVFGTLGALVGYLRLWTLADSIKYIAGAVLIYTTIAAFRGTKISTKRFFAPITALLSAAGVGFVFVVGRGFSGVNVALFLCELVLVFGFAFFSGEVLSPESRSDNPNIRAFAMLSLIAAAALGASDIMLPAGISAGRIAAVLVILLSAHTGGLAAGAAAGVTLGVVFDIGGGGGFFSMSYGLCGLLAGAVSQGGRFATAAAYVLAGGALVLVDGTTAPRFSALYETFVASIVFMLLPEKLGMPRGFELFSRSAKPVAADTSELPAALSRIAGAYMTLGKTFASVPARREVDADITFKRAARTACADCSKSSSCWGDGANTLTELRAAARVLRERAAMEAADLPPAFAARCDRPDRFAQAVTDEFRVGQQELRRDARAAHSAELAREQYTSVAAVLSGVAENLSSGAAPRDAHGIQISAACRRRRGSPESGDRGTWFKTPDGGVTVLLSDGMGSGEAAARASEEVLRLTESFMTAGVPAADSVSAVSSALASRGAAVFATLDLLHLDTVRRVGDIIKCGAAPSYIRGSGIVCRVGGESLPPGVDGCEPVRRHFNLTACDTIVMVTDGTVDDGDDWLCDLVENHSGGDGESLALSLVNAAAERTDCGDDISVIVITVTGD